MNREERIKLYVPHLAQGMGAKAIRSALEGRGVRISLTTLKRDLARAKGSPAHPWAEAAYARFL